MGIRIVLVEGQSFSVALRRFRKVRWCGPRSEVVNRRTWPHREHQRPCDIRRRKKFLKRVRGQRNRNYYFKDGMQVRDTREPNPCW